MSRSTLTKTRLPDPEVLEYRHWLQEMYRAMDFLMRSGSWRTINTYMIELPVMPFKCALAVLRFLPRDARLPEWDHLRDRVRTAIIQSGDMEVTRAMRGLLGPRQGGEAS